MNVRRTRSPEPADREVLAGLVEQVSYHDPDNGFCVLRVNARGHRDPVTVVGRAAAVAAGEWITASGQWVNHRTHGHQFKAHFLRNSAPSSTEGIEKYLRSGLIRGIGQVYARKLVRAFGDKVLDVIETEPERLREVTGIGQVRAGRITDAWAEQKAVREIMVFLHSHGVGTARAVRVFKTYGSDAVEVITNNPYRLTRDIRGIGFRIADAIAMKLGITRTAMTRVRAGIGYALTEAMDDGHCGLPADELGPLAARLLDVPDDAVRTALELELAEGAVVADTVADTPCVFLGGLYQAERAIAERLVDLVAGKLADAGLCRDGAQEPGLGVSGRGHPDAHPALRDAAAEPALHRSNARQAPGGARRAKEGHRHRGPQRRRTQAMVQAGRMVAAPCRPEAPARRRSTAWPALKSCRSLNRALARTERRPHAPSTHRARCSRRHHPVRPTRSWTRSTASGSTAKRSCAPSARWTRRSRSTSCTTRSEANDCPGGARTICLALTMHMQQLAGMPVPDDERDGPTEEGVDEKTIDRLAASIEVLEPAEMVH